MPSAINVSDPENVCNELRPKTCCFCGGFRIWKHGYYYRTCFYLKISINPPIGKKIQRYLCKAAACDRTFSALPQDVLPYCRFFFEDFLHLYEYSQKGGSAYSLGKACNLVGVSLAIMVRLLSLFKKVLPLVQKLYRELEEKVSEDLNNMSHFLVKKYTWFGFTTRWYHALYPARLWENHNPHNL